MYCTKAFLPHELTDEHIIPYALNGGLVLKKAACERCRDRSNRTYEQPALNADFLIPRLLLELNRRKKNQSKSLPKVAAGDHLTSPASVFNVELELSEYGKQFMLITLPRAGKLVGIERTEQIDIRCWIRDFRDGKDEMVFDVTKRHRYDVISAGLMIGKVALCFAAAKLGIEGFDGSEIRELLNGNRTDVFNFVGTNSELYGKLSERSLHALYLRFQGPFITVIVHLFASFGAPPYEVVVGIKL